MALSHAFFEVKDQALQRATGIFEILSNAKNLTILANADISAF